MPLNTTSKNTMLDALDESAAASAGITHLGVGPLTDPGTGTNYTGTEVSGGTPAYARVPLTWGGAAGEQKSNTGALAIDVPPGTYGFLLGFNALTGNTGNYRGYFPMGGSAAIKGFGTVDATLTNDVLFSRGHTMANGDRVMLFNVFAETLPTGLAEGTIYFVVGATADSFQVSLTSGGAAVDITALGGGEFYWQRVVPETFNAQGQVTVAAGALLLDLTAM